MTPVRVVDLRPRTILRVLGIVLVVAVSLEVIWIARHVISWIVIALFLALALDPLVGFIERRDEAEARLGDRRRLPDRARSSIVGVGATFVPKLVDEVNGLRRRRRRTTSTT